MSKVGLIFDYRMMSHHSYDHPHPELPSRLHKLIDSLLSNPKIQFSKDIEVISSSYLCQDDHILMIHSQTYLSLLKSIDFTHNPIFWYLDSYFMKETLESAYLAVGAVIQILDLILKNQWSRGLALVRPPGHHMGLLERPNGFCIFNNIAIAAKYLITKGNFKKLLIFDWDVHHGDGTQELFYDSNQVLFISIHRFDKMTYYPANVKADVSYVGGSEAKGYNINIPWDLLPEQTATTDDYVYIFERILAPIIKCFAPEFILISAGFDSAKGDPLGGLALTNEGYSYMTKRLMDLAFGKVLAILEGGYNLKSLSQGANAVFETLMGEKIEEEMLFSTIQPNDVGYNACNRSLEVLTEYWPILTTDEKALKLENRLKNQTEKVKIKGYEFSGGHTQNFKVMGDKISKITGLKESLFYEDIYCISPQYFSTKDAEIMKRFIPAFFGKEINENLSKPTIIMENLLFKRENCSLLDIKIGNKGLINVSKQKQLAEMAKVRVSTSEEFGFRITGMVIRDKKGNVEFKTKNKEAHMMINKENLRNYLIKFFLSGEMANYNKEGIKFYINFIERLEKFMEESCRLKFAAVSLFLILDNSKNYFDIKLIDFGYWEKTDTKDENIINGIKNLRIIFEEFLL